jgi:3D (Asp-Asp-Asp) domain-containing protein
VIKKILPFIAALIAAIFIWQMYIYFWHNVILIVGKNKFRVPTLVHGTVSDLLRFHNIRLDSNDIVTPPLDSDATMPGIVRVIRVDEKLVHETHELPFTVLRETFADDNLRPVRLQKGVETTVKMDVKVIFYDGKEKYRVILREKSSKKTMQRLVLIGEAGMAERIYNLSTAKKIKMIATAYYPGDPLAWKDGTITFLCQKMQMGIVAVDPRVIPLRTRVYVPGYGYGYAGDTGSAIKWNRIDLGVNNKKEEKPWMHRRVTVYILEKAKTW